MADRKPLVLSTAGDMQQLQTPDELDIPLADRVQTLQEKLLLLATILSHQGIEIPEELLTP